MDNILSVIILIISMSILWSIFISWGCMLGLEEDDEDKARERCFKHFIYISISSLILFVLLIIKLK